MSSSPEFKVKVTGPMSIKAVWRTDYTEAAIIGAVAAAAIALAAYMAMSKARRRTPPPPPPGTRVYE